MSVNVWILKLAYFSPDRTISGDGGNVTKDYRSENQLFLIPQFGINTMLDAETSLGVTLSANGGMNTEYNSNPFVNFGAGTTTGTVATNAPAGVDLAQLMLGLTYAKKIGKHSVGITPTLAIQRFKAQGLQGYEQISSAPTALYDNGYDYSAGYGVRVGYQGQFTDNLTIGGALTSRLYMSRFSKYEGLFADDGSFDIPANATVGAAYAIPDTALTVTADVQYILYGAVDSISNSGAQNFTSTCVGTKALGASEGCGFGWDNQSVLKMGVIYDGIDSLVLRAGYSYNTQVYEDTENMFNILAPAVVRQHVSVGGTYTFSENHSMNIAYTHAIRGDLSGTHPNQPNGRVYHNMDQHDLILGYTYKW